MIDKSIPVKNLMTTDVLYLMPSDCMEKAAHLFESHNIHHIPIINEAEEVVGILSKVEYHMVQDSLTLFNTDDSRENNQSVFRSLLVEEVMTKQVAKLFADDSIEIALGYFRENLFHAMPVIDKKTRKIQGILTTFDLLNYAYWQEGVLAN